MSEIKNDGSDQYDAEPFEQQQFRTAGVEGVNTARSAWDEICGRHFIRTTICNILSK